MQLLQRWHDTDTVKLVVELEHVHVGRGCRIIRFSDVHAWGDDINYGSSHTMTSSNIRAPPLPCDSCVTTEWDDEHKVCVFTTGRKLHLVFLDGTGHYINISYLHVYILSGRAWAGREQQEQN